MQESVSYVFMSTSRVPASLKHNIWITYNGENFNCKCHVTWCRNIITPFTFEAGHNVPSSKGGASTIDNLLPICAACNKSMGNQYTISEFSKTFEDSGKTTPIQPSPSRTTQPNPRIKLNPPNKPSATSATDAKPHARWWRLWCCGNGLCFGFKEKPASSM